MSWSINFIGKPKDLVKAIKDNSETLTGQSKEEYDEATPHIIALLEKNYTPEEKNTPVLKVEANGHAYLGGSSCMCKIEYVMGQIV